MIPGFKQYKNRSVRIFISSTFEDMESERGVLVDDVFPRLRAEFEPMGIDIHEVDLRWGIPEHLSADSRALRICIDEIFHCQPFFMGILGKREGYRPSAKEIELLDEKTRAELNLENMRGLSITEMEMRAGLSVSNPLTASFHIRAADASGDDRLQSLESQITSQGYECQHYDSLAGFAEDAFQSISKKVNRHFEDDDIPGVDSRYRQHLARLMAGIAETTPGPQVADILDKALDGIDVHIWGDEGIGKTATLAHLTAELGEERGYDVFFHFPDAEEEPSDESLWSRLLQFLGRTPPEEAVGVDDVGLWLREHPRKSLSFVIVDDASQFANHRDVRGRLLSLSEMDENLVVICAGDNEPIAWRGESVQQHLLLPSQIKHIAHEYFRGYGKLMEERHLASIGENSVFRNPLMLKCLLNEQRTSLSFKSFEEGFGRLSTVSSFEGLISLIGERISRQLSDMGLNELAVWRILCALALTKRGLRDDEILACTEAIPLEWSITKSAFRYTLLERGGMWLASSPTTRGIFLNTAERHLQHVGEFVRSRLIELFSSLATCPRSIDELAHQYAVENDSSALIEILSSYTNVRSLCASRKEALVDYLTRIQERSGELAEPLAGDLAKRDVDFQELDSLFTTLNQSGCYRASILLARTLRASAKAPRQSLLVLLAKNEARAEYKRGATRYSDAIRLYDEAIDTLVKQKADCQFEESPDRKRQIAELTFKRAIVQKSSGKPSDALSSYEEAVRAFQGLGDEGGDSSWAMGNLAALYYLYGNDEQSGELFEKALRLRAKAFGERSPEVAWTYCYYFSYLFSTGERERAEAVSRDALTYYAESFGRNSPQYAWAEVNRGNMLVAIGNYHDAEKLYIDSITKNDRFHNADGKDGLSTYSLTSAGNIAALEWLAGDRRHASKNLVEVFEATLSAHGSRHPYTCNAKLNVLMAGDPIVAASELPDVISLLEKSLGGASPDCLFAKTVLGAAHGAVAQGVPGTIGRVYLARNNGAQLILIPDWMWRD